MIKLNWNTRAIDPRLKEAVEEIEVLAFATIDDLRNHVYEDDVIGVLHRLFSELEEVDAKDIPKTNRQPTNKVSDKRLQELIDHAERLLVLVEDYGKYGYVIGTDDIRDQHNTLMEKYG